MNFDPWAVSDDPENHLFDTVEAEPEENVSVTANPTTVNVNAEPRIVITLKRQGGYEDPWGVFRAETVKEMKDLLVEAHTEGLWDTVSKAAAAFAATKASGASHPSAPRQQTQAPTQQPSQPQGDGKTCQHGDMVFRSGTNAKGTWKGYFCPTPKGTPDQCRPLFVK